MTPYRVLEPVRQDGRCKAEPKDRTLPFAILLGYVAPVAALLIILVTELTAPAHSGLAPIILVIGWPASMAGFVASTFLMWKADKGKLRAWIIALALLASLAVSSMANAEFRTVAANLLWSNLIVGFTLLYPFQRRRSPE